MMQTNTGQCEEKMVKIAEDKRDIMSHSFLTFFLPIEDVLSKVLFCDMDIYFFL